MKILKKIDYWDMPDTMEVADGYNSKTIPALTQKNLEYVIEKHNELAEVVIRLISQERGK